MRLAAAILALVVAGVAFLVAGVYVLTGGGGAMLTLAVCLFSAAFTLARGALVQRTQMQRGEGG